MSRVDIRRVTRDDVDLFERIAPAVFDEPVRPARLAAYLADRNHLMVVAVRAGEIVGQAASVIHRHPDKPAELCIDEVGVTPGHRRKGIARRMMAEMTAWSCEYGCEEAWLGTEPDNAPANALYRRYADAEPILMYYWEL
ncbi:MAG: GNAT family N-acetyltransferase [Hyphomicrobiaceae bacterium]